MHDLNTGELPCDEWLDRDIQDSDFRVSYSAEEQLRICTGFTPISTSTDMMTSSIDDVEDTSGPSEDEVGYGEKVNALAINLDCMFKERDVKWLKTTLECRPVTSRPVMGCQGPWSDHP